MSYATMRSHIINVFNNNNFEELVRHNEVYEHEYLVVNNNNLNISISYPGCKAHFNDYGLVYDYRVQLNNIALSHTNIIVDLYNKGLQINGQQLNLLEELLIDLAYNGDDFNRNNFIQLNNINVNSPSTDLLNQIGRVYQNYPKKDFNYNGNENWNYSLDELSQSIIWIALQEDINYPIRYCEARRMPFKRYLEALYCSNSNDINIEQVITRALIEDQRPPEDLDEYGINYEEINNINQ